MVEVVPHFGTSTAGTWKSMGYRRFVDGACEAWSTWKGHQGQKKMDPAMEQKWPGTPDGSHPSPILSL